MVLNSLDPQFREIVEKCIASVKVVTFGLVTNDPHPLASLAHVDTMVDISHPQSPDRIRSAAAQKGKFRRVSLSSFMKGYTGTYIAPDPETIVEQVAAL